MRLLLDTHIFLWYITGDPRLPAQVLQAIRDPNNEVYLSAVSVWEIVVKHQIGKLSLPQSPDLYVPLQRQRHHIAGLALDEESVVHLVSLPPLHRDPFDRMLLCQARHYGLIVVSVDAAMRAYVDHVAVAP